MNPTVNIDWKFVVALGVAPSIIVLAYKIDADAAERVLTHFCNVCTLTFNSEY